MPLQLKLKPDLSHTKLCLVCIGCVGVARGASDGFKTAFTNPGATSGHAYLSTAVRESMLLFLCNWDLPRDLQPEQKGLAKAQTPPPQLPWVTWPCALEPELQPGSL